MSPGAGPGRRRNIDTWSTSEPASPPSGVIGPGIGIGILTGLATSAIGRNPDAAGQIRAIAFILGAAFAEGLGVLAIVVGLLAIFIRQRDQARAVSASWTLLGAARPALGARSVLFLRPKRAAEPPVPDQPVLGHRRRRPNFLLFLAIIWIVWPSSPCRQMLEDAAARDRAGAARTPSRPAGTGRAAAERHRRRWPRHVARRTTSSPVPRRWPRRPRDADIAATRDRARAAARARGRRDRRREASAPCPTPCRGRRPGARGRRAASSARRMDRAASAASSRSSSTRVVPVASGGAPTGCSADAASRAPAATPRRPSSSLSGTTRSRRGSRTLELGRRRVADERVVRVLDNPRDPARAARSGRRAARSAARVAPQVRNLVAAAAPARSHRASLPRVAAEFRRLYDQRAGDRPRHRHQRRAARHATRTAPSRGASSEMTGGRVELDTEVDPALLGGLSVRLGDRLIDGSVRGRLERLRTQLASRRPLTQENSDDRKPWPSAPTTSPASSSPRSTRSTRASRPARRHRGRGRRRHRPDLRPRRTRSRRSCWSSRTASWAWRSTSRRRPSARSSSATTPAIKEGDTVKTTGRVVEVPVGAGAARPRRRPAGPPARRQGPHRATRPGRSSASRPASSCASRSTRRSRPASRRSTR